MRKQEITQTGPEFGITLSFDTQANGSVKMSSWDELGGGESWTYVGTKPENLIHEGRIFRSVAGVLIQTGIILDGKVGLGVAWRV